MAEPVKVTATRVPITSAVAQLSVAGQHTQMLKSRRNRTAGTYVRWALLIVVLLGMYALVLYKDYYRPYVAERSMPLTSATRFVINNTVKTLIVNGHIEDVLTFYDKFTGDRQLTYLAVSIALMKDIPINLLFALAQWESGFNTNSDTVNDNGSHDIGWMKCNTYTFKNYTVQQLKDAALNGELGSDFLVQQQHIYGSWEEAVIAYNAGRTDAVKARTINYLSIILSLERGYDDSFVKVFTSRL
jgi:hypothetical protein